MMTISSRIRTLWRKGRSEEHGAELLEAALVLPLLLTLILGIFWIARAYNVYETITRAAREGAHYAVLPNCASYGDLLPDLYPTIGTCLTNPTNVFTGYVKPALLASSLADPTTLPGGSYCQEAVVLDPNADPSVQQCGVSVNIIYPLQLGIPFTSLSATTINLSTQVRMRMENQNVNSSTGAPTCP